jgi:hypothetical protein
MSKLLTMLGAGALAFSIGGIASAADNTNQQSQPQAQQAPQGQPGTPEQREQEYLAALKKCDSGAAADKQKCIDAAKKKHGQM